jgi:flagellar biogenesis protein FliO
MLLCALGTALLGPVPPAAAEDGPTGTESTIANGPVSLAGPPAEMRVTPPDTLPPIAPEGGSAASATFEPPASESFTLPGPDGLFSARPSRDPAADASSGDDGSVLDAVDPRRNGLARVLGALALVLGLLGLVRLVLPRASGLLGGAARPAGIIEVLARYPVARGQTLLLIKMARRILLVHQHAGGMSTLSEVSDPDEVAALLARMEAGARQRDAGRFRTALETFDREHERLLAQESGAAGAAGAAATAARGDIEIVDLTRTPSRGRLGRLVRKGVGR